MMNPIIYFERYAMPFWVYDSQREFMDLMIRGCERSYDFLLHHIFDRAGVLYPWSEKDLRVELFREGSVYIVCLWGVGAPGEGFYRRSYVLFDAETEQIGYFGAELVPGPRGLGRTNLYGWTRDRNCHQIGSELFADENEAQAHELRFFYHVFGNRDVEYPRLITADRVRSFDSYVSFRCPECGTVFTYEVPRGEKNQAAFTCPNCFRVLTEELDRLTIVDRSEK